MKKILGLFSLMVTGLFYFSSCVKLEEKVINYPSGKIKEKYSFYVDENEEEVKDGLWIKWYEDGKKEAESNWQDGIKHGLFTRWYENGEKREESNWIGGKQSGRQKKWFLTGQQKFQAQWLEGFKHGKEIYWYEHGQKKSEVDYEKGVPHGIKIVWHEDGKVFMEEEWIQGELGEIKTNIPKENLRTDKVEYRKGVPAEKYTFYVDPEGRKIKHGEYKEWYPDGQLERKLNFEIGLKHGVETHYHKNGKKKRETGWRLNKHHGSDNSWWETGGPRSTDHYAEGILEGESIHWYADGIKKSEVYYVKNEMEGKAQYWYENGGLKSRYHYKKGKMHGRIIQNYRNGSQKSVCEYMEGIRDGVCTYWHENGQKESEVVFKHGTKQPDSERKWDDEGREIVASADSSLLARLILEEKTVSAARGCMDAGEKVKKLNQDMEDRTRYADLQQKEIQLNLYQEEETERCQEFRGLIGQYEELNNAGATANLAKKHNFSDLLKAPAQEEDTSGFKG
ncbi:toxin-antitoxin system YwqK family antitoxin [Fibrobacterota bacterium]